jgi:hypothetical protein
MQRLVLGIALTLIIGAPGPVRADATEQTDDFGAAITLAEPTRLVDVLANPERYAKKPILIRGRLTDVCQRKGCWTVLQDQGSQLRVRFKDYGFFLPKDAIGSRAQVEGVAVVRTLSEQDARHYEAESRDGDPDSIRGPKREIGLTASGVRLLDPR